MTIDKILELYPIAGYKSVRQYCKDIAPKIDNTESSLRSRLHQYSKTRGIKCTVEYLSNPFEKPGDGISIEETADSKILSGKIEKSITSEAEAIEFFQVDLSRYEVERYVCNPWDVTMKIKKPGVNKKGEPIMIDHVIKRTNYQVKLFLRKIKRIVLREPKVRQLKYKKTGTAETWVNIGCVHVPFHNKILWLAFLHFINDNKKIITGLIIAGDFLDLRSLDTHTEYIPDGIDLGFEYNEGRKAILEIKQAFSKEWDRIKKVFLYGNHEERFYRSKKAIRQYGSALANPHEALKLNEEKFEIITDYKDGFVTLGNNLEVLHGVYFGEHACSKHLSMMPDRSVIFFHTHRNQYFDNGNHQAYNGGCMIDINGPGFKYANRQLKEKWGNGFVIANIDKDGNHYINHLRVTNNNFFFGGKIY